MGNESKGPVPEDVRRARTFVESLQYAVLGLIHTVRTQRNMRVHSLLAFLVLMAAISLGVSSVELAILILTVAFVMVMETVNTAVEAVVDLVTDQYHPIAGIAKNVAAGAVLLSAVASVCVGVVLFWSRLAQLSDDLGARVRALPEVGILIALGAVVLIVVVVKATALPFRLQGGFPSAHAAVAFSLATLIWLVGAGGFAALLGVGIASLVGQARIEAKIHTVFEVISGAVIGALITVAVFQWLFG